MTTIRNIDGVQVKCIRTTTTQSKQQSGLKRAASYVHEIKNSELPLVMNPSLTISGYAWKMLGIIQLQYNIIGRTLSNHYVIEPIKTFS